MLLRSLSIALAGITLTFGAIGTTQAQSIAGSLSDSQLRSKTMQVKQNKSRWNYNRQREGLDLMIAQNNSVSNCEEWAKLVPDDHPQLNPYIFKALYDIAQFGTIYQRTRLGQNIHPNDRDYYNRLKEKADEAIKFCSPSVIGAVPSNYKINASSNIAGGRRW